MTSDAHPFLRPILRPGSLAVLVAAALSSFGAPVASAQEAVDDNWPSFRGYRAGGIAEGHATPTTWNVPEGKGVAWSTPIPGLAHSSPAIWGDRLFVTTAVRAESEAKLSSLYGSENYGAGDSVENEGVHDFRLLCLSKKTGAVLWDRTAHTGVPKVKRHPKSSHANSTPACDAERVIAFFASEGLYCYDHSGELLWKRDLGVLDSGAPDVEETEKYQWGFASSPVLYGERVFVQCDIQDQSFVAALDANTGEDVWRVERTEEPTWGTPTVHENGRGGRAQLILNGYHHSGAYDIETGEEVWKLVGGGDVPVPTPIVAHELIFLTSAHGRMRPIYAIDGAAEGLLTMDPNECEHMAWSHRSAGIYMQTPIVYGEELYACADNGVLACYDAGTGERIYKERLGDGTTGFSGSAVAADGKLYFTAEVGEVVVVQPGPDFEILATNDLGETCMSTPAISAGRLFFRTRHHVVAVGE